LISASFDYLVGEPEQFRRYLKAGCARQSTVLDNLKELTLPRKERAPKHTSPELPAQSGRALNLTCRLIGSWRARVEKIVALCLLITVIGGARGTVAVAAAAAIAGALARILSYSI
jgi:hypothetical protein